MFTMAGGRTRYHKVPRENNWKSAEVLEPVRTSFKPNGTALTTRTVLQNHVHTYSWSIGILQDITDSGIVILPTSMIYPHPADEPIFVIVQVKSKPLARSLSCFVVKMA